MPFAIYANAGSTALLLRRLPHCLESHAPQATLARHNGPARHNHGETHLNNIVQSTWPAGITAPAPADPLDALIAVRCALESGRPIPKKYRQWLARGISAFLKNPDDGLDRALGIVPKVGGRALAGTKQRRDRDALIVAIGATLPGASIAARATGVAQMIKQQVAPADARAAEALQVLLTQHGDHLVGTVSIYNTLAKANLTS